jgi:hypothetical protein
MAEGEGREEESCLIHTEIICPRSSEGFFFSLSAIVVADCSKVQLATQSISPK